MLWVGRVVLACSHEVKLSAIEPSEAERSLRHGSIFEFAFTVVSQQGSPLLVSVPQSPGLSSTDGRLSDWS